MKQSFKLLMKDAGLCLVFSVIVIYLISFLIVNLSIFNPFTNAFKDFSFLDLYYSQEMFDKKPVKDIVVVNIEHKDRFQIHQLIEHVKKQKPKVIGLDIVFKDKKDSYVDSLLGNSLQPDNVILSKAFLGKSWAYNAAPFIKNPELVGYSNLNFNLKTDVIREFEGYQNISDSTQTSFSTLVSKQFLEDKWNHKRMREKLSKPIPINYSGTSDQFFTFSYQEFMETDTHPFLKDKIVLIGYLGTPHNNYYDIEDKFFTPLNIKTAGKSPPDMFGVLIHANIIAMLINNDFIKVIPNWAILFITGIISYLALLYFMYASTKKPVSYMLNKKIVQLLFTVFLLWFSLWLYKINILFKPELIIAVLVLSVEFIGLYKILIFKLNKRYKWKSYFFQD
ncbi:CHASE2 domain-containing protein [Marixanthomonas spongiae]|uniref:CHASE2 domain-containing protein n=1 Tax=Marixanthomonas spongiae TaxID=2174845 RepID=A0A2U0I0A4_9FLAO|nr:CHASE2 domain-containing protein [Marixanthomonas spongiae]PVW14534.1 hypothetical protein DDV96_08360 [Marixanthomonas spongiae]